MRIWHMLFNAPLYFDNVYEDEWIEDGFVKDMIQDVIVQLSVHMLLTVLYWEP